MKWRPAACAVTCLLAIASWVDAAGRAAVLVTSRDCAMQTISALDIRKAYLGIGVSYEGLSIRAFRLDNDERLNQIFFQSVVAMSERTYERRLLLQLLKYGQPRIQHVGSAGELATAVAGSSCSIAYMWQSDAEEWADLKSIKILWQES